MRVRAPWRIVGLATLAVGVGLLTTGTQGSVSDVKTAMYKSIMPDDEFARLVAEDAQIVKEGVSKADDKKMTNKAKTSAFMIAVYSQGALQKGGPKASAMAGLRDSALKVVKAIGDNKIADAARLAADLKAAGKPDPAAKAELLPIHESIEIDEVMLQFKPDRSGGLGMETKLQNLTRKRSFTDTEYQQMVPMLYRIAAIAQPTEALVPAAMGRKTPDKWVKFSQDMGVLSQQAAELAKKPRPDAASVSAALKKLDDNCAACHAVFRDD